MRYILFLLLTACVLSGAENRASWELKRDNSKVLLTLYVPEGGSVHASSVIIQSGTELRMSPVPVVKEGEKVYVGSNTWTFSPNAKQITVKWQECSADGQCFLPEERTFELTGEKKEKNQVVSPAKFTELRRLEGYHSVQDFARFLDGTSGVKRNFLEGKGFFLILLLTLIGGAALNFTPCVLPLIPVTLAIISNGRSTSRERIMTASCYGGGMAAAYGLTGVLAMLGGEAASVWNPASKWYFNMGVGILFILLALAMFDKVIIDFTRFRTRFHVNGAKNTGIFLLGCIAALLAGACVAPVVIAVLLESARLYAAGNRTAVFLPFVLGIGMGCVWPLLAAGFAVLPKPGTWMVHLKHLLGVLILIPGIWYLVTGFSLLVPAEKTEKSALTPEQAFDEAERTGKKLLLDFTASWCKNCKAMELHVLNTPEIRRKTADFVTVRVDATDSGSPEVRKLLKQYSISGLPTFLIGTPVRNVQKQESVP